MSLSNPFSTPLRAEMSSANRVAEEGGRIRYQVFSHGSLIRSTRSSQKIARERAMAFVDEQIGTERVISINEYVMGGGWVPKWEVCVWYWECPAPRPQPAVEKDLSDKES